MGPSTPQQPRNGTYVAPPLMSRRRDNTLLEVDNHTFAGWCVLAHNTCRSSPSRIKILKRVRQNFVRCHLFSSCGKPHLMSSVLVVRCLLPIFRCLLPNNCVLLLFAFALVSRVVFIPHHTNGLRFLFYLHRPLTQQLIKCEMREVRARVCASFVVSTLSHSSKFVSTHLSSAEMIFGCCA